MSRIRKSGYNILRLTEEQIEKGRFEYLPLGEISTFVPRWRADREASPRVLVRD